MAVLSDAQREAGWTVVKLGDIAPLTYGKSLVASKRIPGDVPVYSSAGLIDSHNESIIDGQNIIIGRKGTIGSITWSEGPAYPIDTTFYTAGTEKVNIKYLYYLLKTYKFSEMNTDSAVPGLNRVTFESQEAALPPLEEQERIAGILGSLDDKIEVNTRLIQTIKEYMTALYKAEAKNGKVLELTDIADFVNGRAFTKDATGTGRVVIRIAELNNGLGASTVYNDIEVKEENTAYPGDVLMSWSGSLDTYVWHLPEAIINQHIFKVIPKGNYPKWLVYHACKSVIEDFQAIAVDKATTMGHIRRGDLKRDISIPAREMPQMENLWNLWMNLEQENLQLAATRDALIKRLIG